MSVGDSIAFDSSIPHRFWNETADEVIAVWFVLDAAASDQEADFPTADSASHHHMTG
jgi:hypothetical protein